MSEEDIENLRFLLTIDEATFEDWASKVDEDDFDYAIELLNGLFATLDRSRAMLTDLGL